MWLVFHIELHFYIECSLVFSLYTFVLLHQLCSCPLLCTLSSKKHAVHIHCTFSVTVLMVLFSCHYRVYSGHHTFLISPYDLEVNPLLWLHIVSSHKGTYIDVHVHIHSTFLRICNMLHIHSVCAK